MEGFIVDTVDSLLHVLYMPKGTLGVGNICWRPWKNVDNVGEVLYPVTASMRSSFYGAVQFTFAAHGIQRKLEGHSGTTDLSLYFKSAQITLTPQPLHLSTKFHEYLSSSFSVILLTDKQKGLKM